jgi:predicted nucleic acid-binding protein
LECSSFALALAIMDTRCLSEFFRSRNRHVVRKATDCINQHQTLCTSSLCVYRYTAALLAVQASKRFAKRWEILPIDVRVAERAGRLCQMHGGRARDETYLIAAIAMEFKRAVATVHPGAYQGNTGILVLDWTQP